MTAASSNGIQLRYMTIGTSSGSDSEPDDERRDFNIGDTEAAPQVFSKGRLVLLNVAWFGMMMMFLVLAVAVVPSQIQYLVGERSKAKTLALVAAAGSVVSLIAAPFIGFFSDRCQSRFGRRRPFMLAGACLICLFMVGVAISAPHFAFARSELSGNETCHVYNEEKPRCPHHKSLSDNGRASRGDLALFIICYLIVFFGYCLVSTSYNGLIADLTHPSVRGFSSGVMGLMMLFGNLTGAGLGAISQYLHVPGTYAVVGAIFFSSILLTSFSITEEPLPKMSHAPVDLRKLFLSYIQPLRGHDFFWVFVTRFLMQMGIASTMGFLEYWLDDVVRLPDCMSPVRAVSLALLPLLVTAAFSSLAGGALADRIQRKKPIVLIAAIVMGAAAAGLIGTSHFSLAVIMAVVFGSGLGAYTAVDFALVMDVLPNEKERAKDLAVWHQALLLPQLIATPLGGLIVHKLQAVHVSNEKGCNYGLGYIALFAMSACFLFLSGIFVMKIRSVR